MSWQLTGAQLSYVKIISKETKRLELSTMESDQNQTG